MNYYVRYYEMIGMKFHHVDMIIRKWGKKLLILFYLCGQECMFSFIEHITGQSRYISIVIQVHTYSIDMYKIKLKLSPFYCSICTTISLSLSLSYLGRYLMHYVYSLPISHIIINNLFSPSQGTSIFCIIILMDQSFITYDFFTVILLNLFFYRLSIVFEKVLGSRSTG